MFQNGKNLFKMQTLCLQKYAQINKMFLILYRKIEKNAYIWYRMIDFSVEYFNPVLFI